MTLARADRPVLTLGAVAEHPERFASTVPLTAGSAVLFRPLLPEDLDRLAAFYAGLSERTRSFWGSGTNPEEAAAEACDAIARHDKLRMVADGVDDPAAGVVALIEVAFDLGSDRARYDGYGIELPTGATCRFGPCIADRLQRCGLGSALIGATFGILRAFDQRRIILWGGVRADNVVAIRFYRKNGFRFVGAFRDGDSRDAYDMYRDI